MIQILIADDHEVVRQGIHALLEGHEGWRICAEASTGREAVAQAKEFRPDVVVLDVGMPELNGLEAARQIRASVPDARILILTVHEIENLAQDFVEAGARGYILKSDAGRLLIDAIETLLAGGTFFTARMQTLVDGPMERGVRRENVIDTHLTRREREVLQLIAEGKSNKEIGTALKITTKTAETHRARLMAKLSLHSVADLVRYAIRNQIIEA
ncbi:MAG TPA: response regulator transcription factor [Vicinamibacterales bacterium]